MAYTKNDLMYYKFVLYQVKKMVTDPHGDPVYIKAFDHVMYDLYSIEDFSLRMSRTYKNSSIIKLIDKIGISQLMKLFKNPMYCNILHEMTMISEDLRVLNKKIRKKREKGDTKCIRTDQKTFNDILKLYNKGIKALRKSLKIKDITKAYKDKYKYVQSFVGKNQDRGDLYWDDIDFSGFDEIIDDSDEYDILVDDLDETEFEEFQRELFGGKKRKTNNRRSRGSFEFDDDEDDEGDDSLNVLNDKVDRLCNHMQSLSDTVQGLAAEKHYDTVNNRKTRQTHTKRTVTIPSQDNQMAGDIAEIKDTMNGVVNVLQSMNTRLEDVEGFIEDIDDEDDEIVEYEGGSGYVNPHVQERLQAQQNGQRYHPVDQNNTAAIIDALNNANAMTPETLARISEEA